MGSVHRGSPYIWGTETHRNSKGRFYAFGRQRPKIVRAHKVGEGDPSCLEITDGVEAPGNCKRTEDKPLYLGKKRDRNHITGLC